ncbi:hypothetical protein PHMEG_00017561 [Phytophthora megakarya]|uniref:Uncharacterized protein n=1 Tax=Phytophthora megakarya TaxID=4795 RepID=A0A225VXS4_9STRA|nr:hypothetical protein PHMEG_00017561 [Phytophthora megakarya]
MGGGDVEEEGSSPQEEKREVDSPMDGEAGTQNAPEPGDVEIEGVSAPGPSVSPGGLLQVRPAIYDPQTDLKRIFYRPVDSDADTVRPVEEVLTRSKVKDVRMDVLEY